jgi:anti-sigma factor RsiW
MKRAVMSAGRAYQPSPEFRAKVRQQIGSHKSSRIPWLSLGLATAALVIVGLISVQFAPSRAQTRQVASEIADLHVSNLASSTPVDVVSTDRHTVKPWFQGKLPFTFDLPELAGTDFTLVGGRLVFIEREPAALLLFKYRSHFISVFVLPDSAPVSRLGDSLRKQASFNLQSWQQAGLRYVMITDAEAVHAQRLANLLQTTAGR